MTSKDSKVFYVIYEMTPIDGSGLEAEYVGAMVRAWVQAESVKVAKNRFIDEMQKAGWEAAQFEEALEVNAEDYEQEPDDFEMFQTAVLEGSVYSIHAWGSESAQEQG